jgi:MFS transporter, DHA1 family, multidrug resistance protein
MLKTIRADRQLTTPGRILTLIGIGLAMSLLGDATLYIILPIEHNQAGITAAQVGIMLSANRAIRIILNNPYGEIIERIPRRWMLVPSMFMGAFASLLYTVPGFWPLLIGRLVWGASWAGIYMGSMTVIFDIADDKNRGSLVGRFQMWFFIGIGMSSLLGGLLFDAIGFAPTFYLSAGLILFTALLWWLFLPETRRDNDHKPTTEDMESTPVPVATNQPKSRSEMATLSLAIAVYGLLWLIMIGVAQTLLSILLKDRIGPEVVVAGLLTVPLLSFAGILSGFNTIISMISSPLSGRLSDSSGRRWTPVALALTLGSINLILMAIGSGGVVVVATMLNAIVTSVLFTQLTALVGDNTQQGGSGINRQGRVLGIMNTVGDIGGTVGPLLTFALLPIIGLEGVFTLSALLLLLFLPGTFWAAWHERKKMKHEVVAL